MINIYQISSASTGEDYGYWAGKTENDAITNMVNKGDASENPEFSNWSAEEIGDYDTMVGYMDDDIREDLHSDMAGNCTEAEFFTAYVERHLEIIGEEFVCISGEAW